MTKTYAFNYAQNFMRNKTSNLFSMTYNYRYMLMALGLIVIDTKLVISLFSSTDSESKAGHEEPGGVPETDLLLQTGR